MSEYEFVSGSPEQVEVFMDLQRILVRLYNEWPGDTAIAVYAAALGCVSAMIETQFKRHMEECEVCRKEYKGVTLNLSDVARSNFIHYFEMELEQAVIDQQAATELVKDFFAKGKH
jgi:hypothetical protein